MFFPVVRFEFVDYDVERQVVDNPYIRGLSSGNLKHIFTSRCIESYYPVRTLTYALDYQFWGLNHPGGFKLTNGLIHLANVLLVFWLVLWLFGRWSATGPAPSAWDVPVAAFSAAIFAIHPVVVEPVVWVAGREELLMTLGALGCIHFHLTGRGLDEQGGKPRAAVGCYACAALCCAVACFSNVVGAVIPLIVAAWDGLMPTRPKWRRIVCTTGSLWVIALAVIVIKRLGPEPTSAAREVGVFSAEHLMLILNVYWLNLKTLGWPTNLAIVYSPVEPQSFLEAGVILGGFALGLTALILWQLRRRKSILLGLLWFGLALMPASGIIVHHVHRADRFLYLPLVGLAVAAATALRPLGNLLKRPVAVWAVITAGALILLVLHVRSAAQVQTWQSNLSVWKNCVRADPNNALAHDALAGILLKRGQPRQALEHYKKAMELDWHRPEVLRYLALQMSMREEPDLRNHERAILLAEQACELTQWKDPKFLRTLAVVHRTFGASLAARGQFEPAIENYRKALKTDPEDVASLFDLALLLAMCPNKKLRNPGEAIRLAEQACELTEHSDPVGLMILAAAYAEAGHFERAAGRIEEAIPLAEAAGNAELVAELRYRLSRYQNRTADLEMP